MGTVMTATNEIVIDALTCERFQGFGEVIELSGEPTAMINRGQCARYSDLAGLSFINEGEAGISLFQASGYSLPHTLDLMERHPLGSQAFLPMHSNPFLVIVAPDDGGQPGSPVAFATNGRQGVNYTRNTWHGVLTPIGSDGLFAVVDRIGGRGDNLQEHNLVTPWRIIDRDGLFS